SGVVGLADVLGTLGVLLALLSLTLSLPLMPIALLGSLFLGLYSKESALCAVPLVPFAALVWSPLFHPIRPLRVVRTLVATLVCVGGFVFYVEMRRRWFPATLPADLSVEANEHKPRMARLFATLLRRYAQPILPKDPLNNPFVTATPPLRIAGALRV